MREGVTVSVVPPVDHYQLSGACLWVCTEQLDHTCCYIETIVFSSGYMYVFAKVLSENIRQPCAYICLFHFCFQSESYPNFI